VALPFLIVFLQQEHDAQQGGKQQCKKKKTTRHEDYQEAVRPTCPAYRMFVPFGFKLPVSLTRCLLSLYLLFSKFALHSL
jgi:hypothetical protein